MHGTLRKIIKVALIIFWMLLIYWFSNQPGVESAKMSDGLVVQFVHFLEDVTDISFGQHFDLFVFFIRKLAHLTLYFVLGILFMLFLKEYPISFTKQVIYGILCCLLYACSDEFHQLFVAGRTGKVIDVCIDMIGSLFSIMIVFYLEDAKLCNFT